MPNLNTIYPPVVKLSTKVVVSNVPTRIYFALSEFADINDISRQLQVMITRASDNQNVLKSQTGIHFTTFYKDTNPSLGKYCYYFNLSPDWFYNSKMNNNTVYKIQLRFQTVTNEDYNTETDAQITTWLRNNIDNFSEWSSVQLIKSIAKPYISIDNFLSKNPALQIKQVFYVNNLYNLHGHMYYPTDEEFDNGFEQEYLSRYNITIKDSNTTYVNSGDIYTDKFDKLNTIDYNINVDLPREQNLTIVIDYYTQNGYKGIYENFIYLSSATVTNFSAESTLAAAADSDTGSINITSSLDVEDKSGYNKLLLQRTDNKNKFYTWEDLQYFLNDDINFVDYTVESGTYYKYRILKVIVDSEGVEYRGAPLTLDEYIICNFEHTFLISQNKVLRIKYGGFATSYSQEITDDFYTTIGSKYPFYKKNSKNNYKVIDLEGTIGEKSDVFHDYWVIDTNREDSNSDLQSTTLDNDGERIFETENNLLHKYDNDGNVIDELYDFSIDNIDENTTVDKEFILEREYRNKVYDFLYSGNAILLKTPSEGNVLGILNKVSFSPKNELCNFVSDFSGTFTEIDDVTLNKLQDYEVYEYNKSVNKKQLSFKIGQFEDYLTDDDVLLTVHTSVTNSEFDDSDTDAPVAKIGDAIKRVVNGKLSQKYPNIDLNLYDVSINIYYLKTLPFSINRSSGTLSIPIKPIDYFVVTNSVEEARETYLTNGYMNYKTESNPFEIGSLVDNTDADAISDLYLVFPKDTTTSGSTNVKFDFLAEVELILKESDNSEYVYGEYKPYIFSYLFNDTATDNISSLSEIIQKYRNYDYETTINYIDSAKISMLSHRLRNYGNPTPFYSNNKLLVKITYDSGQQSYRFTSAGDTIFEGSSCLEVSSNDNDKIVDIEIVGITNKNSITDVDTSISLDTIDTYKYANYQVYKISANANNHIINGSVSNNTLVIEGNYMVIHVTNSLGNYTDNTFNYTPYTFTNDYYCMAYDGKRYDSNSFMTDMYFDVPVNVGIMANVFLKEKQIKE